MLMKNAFENVKKVINIFSFSHSIINNMYTKDNSIIWANIMSSANAFDFSKSKILLSAIWLTW